MPARKPVVTDSHPILLSQNLLVMGVAAQGSPGSVLFLEASRGIGMHIQGRRSLHCALPLGELVLLSSSFCLSDEDSPVQIYGPHPRPWHFSPVSAAASWWLCFEPPNPYLTPVILPSLCLPFLAFPCGVGSLDDCLVLALSSFIQLGPSPADSTSLVSLRSFPPFGLLCFLLLPAPA